MKRVEEIKQKREARFMFERFKQANRIEKERDRNIVKKNIAMIRSPAAGLKKAKKTARVIVEEGDDDHVESDVEDTRTRNDNEIDDESEQLMETA